MLIYSILLLFLVIGCFLDLFKISVKNIFFYVNFSLVFILSSIRYHVGVDFVPYENLFIDSLPINLVSLDYFLDGNIHNIEVGYLFLQSLFRYLTEDYSLFLFFYNFIIFLLLFLGMRRSKYNNIQLFIFYCFILINYVFDFHRQGMAMAIFFYSIRYLLDKRIIPYIVCVLIAFLFHYISILLIPVYFLVNSNYSRKTLVLLGIMSFLLSYFGVISELVSWCYNNFNNSLISRVYYYYFIKNDPSVKMGFMAYIQRISILVIIIIFYKKLPYNLTNLIFLCPTLFFLFSDVGLLAGRIAGVFLVSYMYYFSNLMYYLDTKKKLLYIFFFLLLYGITLFYKDINVTHPIYGTYNYIPYKTIFDRE